MYRLNLIKYKISYNNWGEKQEKRRKRKPDKLKKRDDESVLNYIGKSKQTKHGLHLAEFWY